LSTVITATGLGKRYQVGSVRPGVTLRERLLEIARMRASPQAAGPSVWALKDVSFDVVEGEIVGIIGGNGAGKSTLLKILSRITHPTTGSVRVTGRVASLLEVGVGFHSELTGRENIYLNGSILGMRKHEVDQRLDSIVAFAGVETFIDTPIKHFSSGMRLRLGFAVAAHLDPDVLVVDEVLAVGDAAFQKKCLNAMEGLQSSGRTVLFVSHNMAAVENLCTRGIWIDRGSVRMDGPAKEVIRAYMEAFTGTDAYAHNLAASSRRLGTGEIRYTRLEYLSPDRKPNLITRCGDSLVMRLHYRAHQVVRNPSFGLRLYSSLGALITDTNNRLHGVTIARVEPGEGYLDLEIEALRLMPARYLLSLWITAESGTPVYDGDVRVALDVEPADIFQSGRMPDSRYGLVFFPQRWIVPALPASQEVGTSSSGQAPTEAAAASTLRRQVSATGDIGAYQ
jgi:lipopolysaccharide transport system ATP-binding protein